MEPTERPGLHLVSTPIVSKVQEAEEDNYMLTTRQWLSDEELAHFAMKHDPFETDGDIWLGDKQRERVQRLLRGARNHELLALVGEVGSGKSTELRAFMAQAEKRGDIRLIMPASLDRTGLTEGALAGAICRHLSAGERDSIPSSMEERSEKARQLLVDAADAKLHPVLVVDEAHDLSLEGLIAIKRIWDPASAVHPLGVLLVGQGRSAITAKTGQSSTKDLAYRLLRDYRLRELGQRTRVIGVDPLASDEIQSYLTFRWKRAGEMIDKVLEPSVPVALARASALAYPLTLANTVIMAMRKAFEQGEPKVTGEHVLLVLGK